ncbi:MAG: tRNA pseudouridine(38-40) synthase TruA [Chloroflexi bacterium]|nr:tRNA pseudouridine(38-40) synthase TruA [Chloroflexota bacterium]
MALIVEYDGTRYYGFQFQGNLPTVQEEIEKALGRLTGEKVRVLSASRTDTGVHAKGQVVSFRTHSALAMEEFVGGLNFYLPRDIAVKAAHRVDNSFNVQKHAVSREYWYYIFNSSTRSPLRERFSYHVSGKLDIDKMNHACQVLIGPHDFASFASRDVRLKSTVRNVFEANVERDGELVVFNMVANSFLPHQIRNTVGTLIRIGQGRLAIEKLHNIMEAKKPGLAGPAVPANGLFLVRINYPGPFGEEYE